jgi:hypothetical protein
MRKLLNSLFLCFPVLFALGVIVGSANAASVGGSGYTTGFAAQPPASDWSSSSFGSAAGTISTAAGMDAAVQGFAAGSITTQLAADPGDPPALFGTAVWSSSGLYLQTRPTGNDATLLMCTLVNNLGVAASSVSISYDFAKVAVLVEEIPGQRAYYSLTGAAGSWTVIPQFSSASPGRLTANLNINWPSGSTLYILWCDDNDSPSPDTACQIDNFAVTATPSTLVPVTITNQPQNQIVGELQPVTFSVGAQGVPSPTFQWYTNDVAIIGATNPTYSITSTPLSYNGLQFKVIAQNTVSNVNYSATSTVATLTVNADTVRPVLLSAAPSGLIQVVASFSERLAPGSIGNVANYSIVGPAGALIISNAVLDASQTNIFIGVSPMTPGSNYTLTVNNVTDQSAAANAVANNSQIQFTATVVAFADIGSPTVPGSVANGGNGFNVTSSGTNISGVSDQFSFGYQQLAGNFNLKLRLDALSAFEAWAKGGLMARETLTSTSRFAATLAGPSVAGVSFSTRTNTATVPRLSGFFPVNYPYTWLRLQRAGDVFTGYASFDGQNWVLLGSVTLTMPTTLFVGYAVSSANASQPATAQFRDIGDVVGGSVVSFVPEREPLSASTRRTGLVISEIMYHPKARTDGKDLEFIELYNSMSIFEDISGYRLSGDVDFTFPPGTVMQAGQFIVLAKVAADVQSVYGTSGVFQYGVTNYATNVFGGTTNITVVLATNVVDGVTNIRPDIGNALNNGGGNVRLHNRAGAILLDARFSTEYPWPIEADGAGHSLILARPSYGEQNFPAWGPSDSIGGTPGGLDIIGPEPARNVVINEFLAHTDPPLEDMVELYNHGNTAVDISGFWLSDDPSTNKFRIPNGTVLGPRGFTSFTASTNAGHTGFALSSSGERIFLINSNQNRVIEAIGFEGQENGVSMGRYPDGAPTLRRLSAVTAGTSNAAPLVSPIVINEIMYNPISGDNNDEFVELYNRSASPVDLSNWRFVNGIDFTFPAGTVMQPGAYLVVAENANHLLGIHAHLGPTNLVGNFGGSLNNGGERLSLAAPDYDITTNGSGQVITNIPFRFIVNEVTYGDGGRWGNWSDGGGSSLELIDPDSDNSLPSNWADSDETSKSSWTSFENTAPVDWTLAGQGVNDTVHIFMLGVGECIVDDVEVRNNLNQNLVANSNFEGGLTGWNPRGSHDQSFSDNNGFIGRGMRILAQSRGDNGINRIRATLNPQLTTPTGTVRGKARWLRGFPEVLIRVHGGGIEAFGRLPVPPNLGSPGAPNSTAVPNAGPAIYDVTHSPVLPQANEQVLVTARVHDPDGLSQFVVRYRIDPGTTFNSASLVDNGTGGDAVASDGLFTATLPGQNANVMVAFYVQAVDGAGKTNLFPANALNRAFPSDAPAHEALVRWGETQMAGSFATYHLWITEAMNQRWSTRDRLNNARLDGTFVYNNYRVIYNMMPQYGGSPWHRGAMQGPVNPGVRVDYVLNFPEDNLFLGTTDFVINNVGNPGGGNTVNDNSGMIEQLSYEIFKGINVHYNYRRYIHMFVNGNQRSITGSLAGNYIMEDSQQPNGDVIEQWYPDDTEGQLYKIEDWFEMSDDAGAHANDDADLTRRMTTYNGVPTLDIAPYRFMWRKRSLDAGDSANNYSNLFTLIDIVSPPANPAGSPLPDATVKQFAAIADFEQWMRIFAVQRTVGNWDAYGWERGKNAYTYRPERGKFSMMTWDIDFTMGVDGRAATAGLFAGTSDPRVGAMYNTPEIVRAYWRAFRDIVNGPLSLSYLDPLIDARTAAFRANNVNYNPAVITGQIRPYITARQNYIASQLATVAGNFNVTTTDFTTSSNIVTISGTAPIDVKFIEIDGVNYPIVWTNTTGTIPTTWSLRLPMSVAGLNSFTLRAFDRNGAEIPNTTRTINVNYTGVIADPSTNIVFNEIMFNALIPGAEYVELYNRSTSFTFDIGGWRINGLDYTFPEGATLGPRAFIVLAKDRVAFGNAYGGALPVFDQFSGDLQLDGETLTLIKPGATPAQDLVVDRVRYDGVLPWPAAASGTGSSFQLLDPNQDNSRVGNWFSSYTPAVYCCGVSEPARTNEGWRFVSVSGNVASGIGGGQMRLMIYLNPELGSAIIDDLALVAGTNAGVGPNFIHNGDFESTPLLENPALTNSWIVGTNYTNTTIISDLVHGGNGALKIVGSSFGNSFPRIISQLLSPAPVVNTTNTLSFWYWATNSSTNLNVRLQNSSQVNVLTNINIMIIPSNYVPPQVVSPATNTLSPGATNQMLTSLPAFPTLWINEVQADNLNGILDNAGEREPWIELYNNGTSSVSLDGLYLSTSYANLTAWAFPAGRSIGAGQFMVIFCDGEPGETTGTELHTSFQLPSGSGSIALSRINNSQPQIVDYVNYTDVLSERSYGSFPDGQPFFRQELFYVTPGAPNDGRSAPLTVFINEWMASNTNYIADPADLDFDDWFEIYNPGTNTVDLAGYYLTDVLTNKTKYLITTDGPHTIGPGGFLLVWADNETGQNVSGGVPRSDLHVNFQLAAGAESIGLFAADGTQIDAVTFSNQVGNVSEGRFPNGGPNIYAMPGPPTNQSPRASNFVPGLGNNPPALNPIGSKTVYVGQTLGFTVTATDPDPGQVLAFTLNGAPPGASIVFNTGLFSWTPGTVGTYVMTFRVTDNGSPVLDDFENVVVRVLNLPNFAVPTLIGNDLTLSWGATVGRTYRVEYKNDLSAPTWTQLGQNLTATSDTLSINDNITGAPQRFYRLVLLP